jgi:hypothetical protein
VDDGGKVHEKGVTHGLDDYPVMFSNRLLDNLIVNIQQPQHTGFIAAHLTAKAHHIGEHNRGQAPSFRMHCDTGLFLHGDVLFCWRCLAVNRSPSHG